MIWRAEQLLTAIRDNQMICHCITEERLVKLTGLKARQVETAAITLCKNGLLEKTAQGCHMLTRAGLEALKAGATVRSGPKGRHTGKRIWNDTMRERVWRAIRIRRKFTVPEIIVLVADGSETGDCTNNVQKYVRALAKADYLAGMPRRESGIAPTSNGYKRWWLVDTMDSGPQAPVWSARKQTVYDPNSEKTVDISPQKSQGVKP